MALRHLVYLSRQWGLPLLACKLDVQAAFDTLSHDAVARFLASLGAHQESKLLLDLMTRSAVNIIALPTTRGDKSLNAESYKGQLSPQRFLPGRLTSSCRL